MNPMIDKDPKKLLSMVIVLILSFIVVVLPVISNLNEVGADSGHIQNMDKLNLEYTGSRSLSYLIVDTNQSIFYSGSSVIAEPAEGNDYYGQDAHYPGNQPSYTDNGDGTITDLVTGLMWQADPNGFNRVSWNDAMADASSITTGGYNDWRVPTIKELYSLIDFSGSDPSGWEEQGGTDTSELEPFIDTAFFGFEYGDVQGNRVIDTQYWSSNEYVSTTMNGDETVFGVNFADGRIKGYGKVDPMSQDDKEMYIQYVRSGSGYGQNSFTDNGDGTITDTATGLMWMKDDRGSGLNWQDALSYSEDLSLEGYDDWRLPSVKELQSIVDYSRSPATTSSPAMDPIFNSTSITDEGDGNNWPFYWSGTTHATWNGQGGNGCYVAFGEALGFMEMPPNSGNYNLLDVHGAGAQRSDPKDGDPENYPNGHGPQGDVIRIFNYIRCVRDVEISNTPPVQTSVIPDLDFPEDGSGGQLMDVLDHFSDDHDSLLRVEMEHRNGNDIGWEMDGDGHHINFISPDDWFGSEEFRLSVFDSGSDGITDNQDDEFIYSNWFNVTVTPTDDAPVILTVNGTSVTQDHIELIVSPGPELLIEVVTEDIDGDFVLYSSNSTLFVINETTGVITANITHNYTGSHHVNITATEVNGSVQTTDILSDSVNIIFTVRSTNDRPQITGFKPTNSALIDYMPGATVLHCSEDTSEVWSVEYVDPDGDACTFTTDFNHPRFVLISDTGEIRFSPVQEDVGDHILNISVSDGWLQGWAEFVIRVENVNDAPVAKTVNYSVAGDNKTVTFTAGTAQDEDGDKLTYTWDFGDGEVGAGMTADHTYNKSGNYVVVLTVSDGNLTDKVTLNISLGGGGSGDDDTDGDDDSTEDDDSTGDDDTTGDNDTAGDDDTGGEDPAVKKSKSRTWVIILLIILVVIIAAVVIIMMMRKKENGGMETGEEFNEEL